MTWKFICRFSIAHCTIPVIFKRIGHIEIKQCQFKDFIIEKNWYLFIDAPKRTKKQRKEKRCIDVYSVNIVNMINYVATSFSYILIMPHIQNLYYNQWQIIYMYGNNSALKVLTCS